MATKRGPLGLAKSAKKNKRSKRTTEPEEEAEETFEIPEDVDPDDELGQLFALYDNIDKSDPWDPRIFHAIVHECDRILRNSESSELPARFHVAYARALFMLASFAKIKKKSKTKSKKPDRVTEEGPEDFIQAALERSAIGLEQYPDSFELRFSRCRYRVAFATLKLTESIDDESVTTCVPRLQEINEDFVETVKLSETSSEAMLTNAASPAEAVTNLLTDVSKLYEMTFESDSLLKQNPELYTWVITQWQRKLDQDPDNKSLHRALGEFLLSRSHPHVRKAEENMESEIESSNDEVAIAVETLKDALEQLCAAETEDDSELMVVIAEAQVSLANLTEDVEEQEKLYAKAIDRLKRAQALGGEDFSEMIAELQGDGNDGDDNSDDKDEEN
ncbi:nuclear pore complex subunit Nro1-domain-containing protein [Lipomyces arxii]|uniref:nuclear pore complex subunit Nro1-domain-containing protein n=1 Tax=Lipomyces arxii TaxID=56418 RepID=UPI0034CF0900